MKTMAENSLLIVASKGSQFYTDTNTLELEQLEHIFDVRATCFCVDLDCLKEIIANSSDVLYFDTFPSNYQTVRSLAAAQWRAPRVVGVETHDNCIRVQAGDYTGKWVPQEKVLEEIRTGVQNYKEDIASAQIPWIAALCFLILLFTILIHLYIARPIECGSFTNTGSLYDSTPSISTRQIA